MHGSAPDIAGQGIANPVAAFLSAAMMLEWLGHPAAAQQIRESCAAVLAQGATPDVGGSMTTDEVTEAVTAHMLGAAG